ncbi:unnamed protein product [Pleuronectes platessa]|uniref:Uncharacterized protein n=1 Tax=Pleuronectes platessa TaxID=8262 RepID=A0A9N7Y233_PLEPL|nr:unnamed protein product [Pleuronectes platessa]
MMASQVELGVEAQPAPEISLGLPSREAVDMKCMVAALGQPEDHLLRAGKYSQLFFIEEEGEDSSSWRLMVEETMFFFV